MPRTLTPIETLTPRELEVLRLIAAGKTNPEIAEALGIRFETAKWHVSEVLQKLQVASREDAAREYRRYRRLPSRLGRSLAAIPIVAKWAAGGVAAALVVGVVAVAAFLRLNGDDEPPLDPGVYVAYLPEFEDDFVPPGADDGPAGPIVILNVDTGESYQVGEPRRYRSVWWAPDGDRLAALALTETQGEAELLLVDTESGATTSLTRTPIEPWNPSVAIAAFGYAPALRWSPDGSLMAVAWPGAVSVFSSDGDVERDEDPICPGEAAGYVAWSPSAAYLLQPCVDGIAWLDAPGGEPAFLSWDAAGLLEPEAPGGLATAWMDDATVRLTPYGDFRDPTVLELSLADPGNPALRTVPGLSDEEIWTLQGEAPFSELIARLSDAQRQAFADAGLVISGGAPGATPGTWVIGGVDRERRFEHELLALFFDGTVEVVELPVSWDDGAGLISSVNSGWSWLGPVAHLLVLH